MLLPITPFHFQGAEKGLSLPVLYWEAVRDSVAPGAFHLAADKPHKTLRSRNSQSGEPASKGTRGPGTHDGGWEEAPRPGLRGSIIFSMLELEKGMTWLCPGPAPLLFPQSYTVL